MLVASCSTSLNEENLAGKWNYVRIENLNRQSEDSTTMAELKAAAPFIQFSKSGDLEIIWEGQILSSGTYFTDGKMIRYKESLPGGSYREFPFLVKSISATELVFETMATDGTRVYAVKEK